MNAPTEPTAYVLPAALRASLLQYLMSRPYAEVDGGVRALFELQPITAAGDNDVVHAEQHELTARIPPA